MTTLSELVPWERRSLRSVETEAVAKEPESVSNCEDKKLSGFIGVDFFEAQKFTQMPSRKKKLQKVPVERKI